MPPTTSAGDIRFSTRDDGSIPQVSTQVSEPSSRNPLRIASTPANRLFQGQVARRATQWGSQPKLEPTGLVKLVLGHGVSYVPVLASDTAKRGRLEDKLGRAFERLARLADEAEERAREHEERELARCRGTSQGAGAGAGATDRRAATRALLTVVANHERAARIRRFAAEMRADRPLTPGEEEWLRWALNEADRLEPGSDDLAHPPEPPEPPSSGFGRW